MLVVGTVSAMVLVGHATALAQSPDAAGPVSLAEICPNPIVIQADWEPEAEHGAIYQLMGQPATIDTAKMRATGPLVVNGQTTGVDLEVRIGGNSVGYLPVASIMATDPEVFMAFGGFTDAISSQGNSPLVGVVNIMEKSPRAIYWDPATYTDVQSIMDLKTAGPNGTPVTINMGQSGLEQTFLLDNDIILESQIDTGDVGKPAKFIAAGGTLAEVGFLTAEPYMYEKLLSEWGKPLTAQLLDDVGYHEYFMPVYVRPADVTASAECLTKLVPIIQQAQADYLANPGPTNDFIVRLVETYDDGWTYDPGMAAWSADQQKAFGIISNGADGVLGSFDADRVQSLIDFVVSSNGLDPSAIDPTALYTNQFLDPTISLVP